MSGASLRAELQRTLTAVLDELVPARDDGGLPGAGSLGIGSYVLEKLGDAAAGIVPGLTELESLAAERGAGDFASAPSADRVSWMNEAAAIHPGFLESLVFHTYSGYYQSPEVLEAIGLPARPPYPEGYEVEQGDLGLLDPVRARPKLYREA